MIGLYMVGTVACAEKGPEDTATTGTSSDASASSGETPTTGTAEGTSGLVSATGEETSGGVSSSTGAATSGDPATGTSDGSSETGAGLACDEAGMSNLEGVCLVFTPQQDSFTLAEAATGIEFRYALVVVADVADVYTESLATCTAPGAGGLFIGETIGGDGQAYCECDNGPCNPSDIDPFVLKAGVYPAAFTWDGVNWNGPSDTNNPKGPPFPPGNYTVRVRAIGQHAGVNYEVIGELPITLSP